MAYIYALADPSNPRIPRYIGRTKNSPKQRWYEHMVWAFKTVGVANNPLLKEWLLSLDKIGKMPVLLVYEIVPDKLARQREHFWTVFFRPLGLLNIKTGDAQPSGDNISTRRKAWLKTAKGQQWLNVTQSHKHKQPSLLIWGHQQHFKRLRSAGAMKSARPVICVETKEVFRSVSEAARKVKKDRNSISGSIKEGWKAAGFHWAYASQEHV